MVLDKLPVPGRPTNLDNSRASAYCARGGGGVVWTFYSHLSFLVFKNWALFDLDSRRTDRLGARSVQLWIRSVVPSWEHRYGHWTKEKKTKTKKKEVIQKSKLMGLERNQNSFRIPFHFLNNTFYQTTNKTHTHRTCRLESHAPW